jgi:hypothetical protein
MAVSFENLTILKPCKKAGKFPHFRYISGTSQYTIP